MDSHLERYLNDHLAGSASAVDLIGTLREHATEPDDQSFFDELKRRIEEDQTELKRLLQAIGREESSLLQAAGTLTAKAGRIKFQWEGLDPKGLGMFEALELLALGIQGKRLLWSTLGEISHWIPEWTGTDFHALEADAVAQRTAVEDLHHRSASAALIEAERRLIRVLTTDVA